jgi:methionyl-tRNA formyltransferase
MKIGILASGDLGHYVINRLPNNTKIDFIATDKSSDEIINFSAERNIPCFNGNPRNGNLIKFLSNLQKPRIILSINYLFLIDKHIIDSFDDIINFHGSLLPKYRGRTPHVWAIINNEKVTGITAHKVDEGCDTGPILKQIKIPILKHYTGNDILIKFKELYPQLVWEVLELLQSKKIIYKQQNEKKGSFFGKRKPEDGLINWSWHRERIYNWVRAQAEPYPGAYAYINEEKLIIDEVRPTHFPFHYKQENGLVLGRKNNNNIIVKTPNGPLELIRVRNSIIDEIENGTVLNKKISYENRE